VSSGCRRSYPDKRPWIDPDNPDVDDLARVIMQCPTGALQFEQSDGGPHEPVPEDNTVTVVPDGRFSLLGDIETANPDGEGLGE